jgi:hypothetical protein
MTCLAYPNTLENLRYLKLFNSAKGTECCLFLFQKEMAECFTFVPTRTEGNQTLELKGVHSEMQFKSRIPDRFDHHAIWPRNDQRTKVVVSSSDTFTPRSARMGPPAQPQPRAVYKTDAQQRTPDFASAIIFPFSSAFWFSEHNLDFK